MIHPRTIATGCEPIAGAVWCDSEQVILKYLRRGPLVGDVLLITGELWAVVRAEDCYELQRARDGARPESGTT